MTLYSRIFASSCLVLGFACASPNKSAPATAAAPKPAPSAVAPHKSGDAAAKNSKAAPAAEAKSAAAPSGGGVGLEKKCNLNNDHRTIVVVPKDAGCEVHYVKNGSASVVASSANGTNYCDGVQAKMAKNLEGSGFACR